ncbi:MAG TPA: hypothetical protein VHY08_10305 [Bacillota bacterium]|nr:hypothetical protein [Bacillota bacterium]
MQSFTHKKYLILTAILLALFFVTGCLEDPLVGEWAVVNDNGIQAASVAKIFTFHSDQTLTVYENNPVGGTVTYQSDSTKDPIWIGWNGALGIIRFIDNNTLELSFNRDQNVRVNNNFGSVYQTVPATRPVTFDQSQFHFILRRLAQAE